MDNRSFLIKNVELNWAKLDAPVAPFGTPQWEIQIATTDKAVADDLSANHVPMKEVDGKFVASLKRKSTKQDGSDNDPVRLVGADKLPMTDRRGIGNGSTGNVIVYQMNYEFGGRKGITNILTAVQVTDLVEYSGGTSLDFDIVDAAPAGDSDASLF